MHLRGDARAAAVAAEALETSKRRPSDLVAFLLATEIVARLMHELGMDAPEEE
jgi:hypothetical protein